MGKGIQRYRVFSTMAGQFREANLYEFIAEFASEQAALDYTRYLRGKDRFCMKDIIVKEVIGEDINPKEGKAIVACAIIGEYLTPEEWKF